MLTHRGGMGLLIAQSQQRTVNLRMQRFYPAVHHLRETRHRLNADNIHSGTTELLGRSPRADDFNSHLVEFLSKINNAILVRHTN